MRKPSYSLHQPRPCTCCKPLLAAVLFIFVGLCGGAAIKVLPVGLRLSAVEAESSDDHPGQATEAAPLDGPVIIIGFVGGYVRHTDTVHSVVQVAARLRSELPSDAHIAVFENRRREQAHLDVLRILDAGRPGNPSEEEKKRARIILYGHSWGASETVALAQELARDGIPVLLTIQVDSVAKLGLNDGVIPANVSYAVNFYQSEGLLHGRSQIRAADPQKTIILGSFRFDYKTHPLACQEYPWYARMFMKAHTEIECDPGLWGRVESLIRTEVRRPGEPPSFQ
jgi:pimeloyl-ACP methyl ester carboxylesterase